MSIFLTRSKTASVKPNTIAYGTMVKTGMNERKGHDTFVRDNLVDLDTAGTPNDQLWLAVVDTLLNLQGGESSKDDLEIRDKKESMIDCQYFLPPLGPDTFVRMYSHCG